MTVRHTRARTLNEQLTVLPAPHVFAPLRWRSVPAAVEHLGRHHPRPADVSPTVLQEEETSGRLQAEDAPFARQRPGRRLLGHGAYYGRDSASSSFYLTYCMESILRKLPDMSVRI